jgi:hypothetical protein
MNPGTTVTGQAGTTPPPQARCADAWRESFVIMEWPSSAKKATNRADVA